MLVISSLDRLASVKYPDRFLFKNKLKFQILIVSIIFLIFGCLNIPSLVYRDVKSTYYNNRTFYYCEITKYEFYAVAIDMDILPGLQPLLELLNLILLADNII